jgi:hypothetical protein
LVYLGQAHHAMGHFPRAMEVLGQAMSALEGDLGRRRFGMFYRSICQVWLVWCLAEVGAFTEGETLARDTLREADAADNLVRRIGVSFSVGHLYLSRGNLDRAIAVSDGGRRLSEAGDIPLWTSWLDASLGAAYALLGRIDEALPLLERAVAESAAMSIMAVHARLVTT